MEFEGVFGKQAKHMAVLAKTSSPFILLVFIYSCSNRGFLMFCCTVWFLLMIVVLA